MIPEVVEQESVGRGDKKIGARHDADRESAEEPENASDSVAGLRMAKYPPEENWREPYDVRAGIHAQPK